MVTIEQRINAIAADAERVTDIVEFELKREIVYTSRAKVLIDAIAGVFKAMNVIEAEGVPTDFNDDWTALRLRLADARSQFKHVLNGAGDVTLPPCQVVPRQ
jgi:hypothetical protein